MGNHAPDPSSEAGWAGRRNPPPRPSYLWQPHPISLQSPFPHLMSPRGGSSGLLVSELWCSAYWAQTSQQTVCSFFLQQTCLAAHPSLGAHCSPVPFLVGQASECSPCPQPVFQAGLFLGTRSVWAYRPKSLT